MTLPKFFLIVSFFSIQQIISQGLFEGDNNYTLQDSLRGSITKERAWWDLNFYHLNIKVDRSHFVPFSIQLPVPIIQFSVNTPST